MKYFYQAIYYISHIYYITGIAFLILTYLSFIGYDFNQCKINSLALVTILLYIVNEETTYYIDY